MRNLKENTFESYWSNGNVEALKKRFHEICSELGVWTKDDKGCENFGLYLKISKSYSDDNELHLRIVSPKYYLSSNGADMWTSPDSTEDFDEWVIQYIKEYSWLFNEGSFPEAYKHLVKSENPEPWNTFIANEGRFRKALGDAFKSPECKYITLDEQYDLYGEVQFEVNSVSGSDDELAINMAWEESSNPDSWTTFKFDSDLNYTATMNDEIVTGQGYEDAANQYVLRIANKYAEGEFAKDYEPECYELRVYLKQDFYTKASKNIWQGIENILEDNCSTYTNYQPEDWVDDRAAVWNSVEVDDLKRVLSWLKKRRSAPRIEIWDENKNNVTSQFWTPKVKESTKILEDRNCVVVKLLDPEDDEARAVIESYGGQLNYRVWSISKENVQDVKEEIDDWENRIAFYSSYKNSSGRFGKKLKEDVILHFDLEDGTHKALPFKSEEDALDYMDSDDFPIGEWVGEYTIEPVDSATVSASNGDEDDFYDEDDYDEPFYILLDKGFHKIQEYIDAISIYKTIHFSNKDDAIAYALGHPEVKYVQEMFGPDLCDCYEGDFVWERGQESTSLSESEESEVSFKEDIFDFTDFDEDEDTFENLVADFKAMRVNQEEMDALGLKIENSTHGPYGIYPSGNGIPDIVIYDFETPFRVKPYHYKISICQTQENVRSKKLYNEIYEYLLQKIGE